MQYRTCCELSRLHAAAESKRMHAFTGYAQCANRQSLASRALCVCVGVPGPGSCPSARLPILLDISRALTRAGGRRPSLAPGGHPFPRHKLGHGPSEPSAWLGKRPAHVSPSNHFTGGKGVFEDRLAGEGWHIFAWCDTLQAQATWKLRAHRCRRQIGMPPRSGGGAGMLAVSHRTADQDSTSSIVITSHRARSTS